MPFKSKFSFLRNIKGLKIAFSEIASHSLFLQISFAENGKSINRQLKPNGDSVPVTKLNRQGNVVQIDIICWIKYICRYLISWVKLMKSSENFDAENG